MNYYLAPEHIADTLGISGLRRSTPDGLFLLTEQDIVAYGKQRAMSEGAIVLSNRTRVVPSSVDAAPQESQEPVNESEINSEEESAQEEPASEEQTDEDSAGEESTEEEQTEDEQTEEEE